MRQTDTRTGVGTSAVGPGMKIGFIEQLNKAVYVTHDS